MSKKTIQEQEVTGADIDGSYLNNVSQATTKGNELLEVHSLNMGSEAILSTLKSLEESKREIVACMDRIKGNSTVSSTPIPPVVATGRDKVTFRLPKPKSTSPVKSTVGEVTPRANLINSYKWPAREELVYPGVHSAGLGDVQGTTGRGKASEQGEGYCTDTITPSVDKLRSFPEVSYVVANLLADCEAWVQQEVVPGKPLSARRKSGRYNTTETPNARPEVW